MANTYLDVVGAPPRPNTLAFLAWVDRLVDHRRKTCDFPRTGPTYYFSQAGDDTTGSGTEASPWKSLSKVQSVLDGLSAQNETDGTTILFRRGDIWRESAHVAVEKNHLRFGAYGDPNLDRPVMSFFTILVNAGNVNWTNHNAGADAKNRWSIALANVDANPAAYSAVGWIRERGGNFAEEINSPLNPYMAVNSTTEVEDNPKSFYHDAAASRIHVNPGYFVRGTNEEAAKMPADALDWEATGDVGSTNFPACFRVGLTSQPTGLLFEEIDFAGWGCSARNYSGASSITVLCGGDSVVLIRDCDDFYGGRHSFCQQVGGTSSGGIVVFERCRAGYTNEVKSQSTIFNSFAPQGGHECLWIDCEAAFGALPDNQTSSYSGKPYAWAHGECLSHGSFYGHSGDGYITGLQILLRCKLGDHRDQYPYATCCYPKLNFNPVYLPGNATDPTTWRHYVIGFESTPRRYSRTADPTGLAIAPRLPQRGWLINSRVAYHRNWTASTVIGLDPYCVLVNTILEVLDSQDSHARIFASLNSTSSLVWWINGALIARGPASGTTIRFQITDRWRDRFRLANLLLVSPDAKELCLSLNNFPSDSPQNGPANIAAIAGFGVLHSNSGSQQGFDQAAGRYLNLNTDAGGARVDVSERIGRDHILAGKGLRAPFADVPITAPEYDWDGRPRSTLPSIGPFESPRHSAATSARPLAASLVFDLVT